MVRTDLITSSSTAVTRAERPAISIGDYHCAAALASAGTAAANCMYECDKLLLLSCTLALAQQPPAVYSSSKALSVLPTTAATATAATTATAGTVAVRLMPRWMPPHTPNTPPTSTVFVGPRPTARTSHMRTASS